MASESETSDMPEMAELERMVERARADADADEAKLRAVMDRPPNERFNLSVDDIITTTIETEEDEDDELAGLEREILASRRRSVEALIATLSVRFA